MKHWIFCCCNSLAFTKITFSSKKPIALSIYINTRLIVVIERPVDLKLSQAVLEDKTITCKKHYLKLQQ